MPPPPKYPETSLVLVPKDSKDRIVLEHATLLKEGKTAPLTLASHVGLAIAPQWDAPCLEGEQTVLNIGLGPPEFAVSARLEEVTTVFRGETTKSFFFVADPPQGSQEEMVFDVGGQFEEGTNIRLIREAEKWKKDTFNFENFSRLYLLNDDGTVSTSVSPGLVFGVGSKVPDTKRITLVAKDAPGRFVFENAELLRRGEIAALTLTSHPGMAIVPVLDEKLYFGRYYVIQIGIGPADGAVVAGLQEMTRTFRGETFKCSFLLAKKQLNLVDEMVFKVERGVMSVGTPLNLVREVSDGVNYTFVSSARMFVVNEDGTISPQIAPCDAPCDAPETVELVLGFD